MNRKELKRLECAGSPREMGRAYGEQAFAEIRHNLERFPWKPSGTMLDGMKRAIAERDPEILEELTGIAEGADVSEDALIAMNHWELTQIDDAERCTVAVVRSERDGLLIAKNNDSPLGEDYRFVIRRGTPAHGIPFLQVCYAGSLSGLDMMNAEGLCNTHGSVGSRFARPGIRLDIRLRLYRLMRSCRDIGSLIRGLHEFPLTGKGFSIAVADRQGNSAILDAAVPFFGIRAENRPFAYSTNLYEYPGLEDADMRRPDRRTICLQRQAYLRGIEQTNPPRTLEALKKLLSSHDPWAPCRHGGAHQSVTDWSMIGIPHKGELWVAQGFPCTEPYREVFPAP